MVKKTIRRDYSKVHGAMKKERQAGGLLNILVQYRNVSSIM
jgi:hypothetical protein